MTLSQGLFQLVSGRVDIAAGALPVMHYYWQFQAPSTMVWANQHQLLARHPVSIPTYLQSTTVFQPQVWAMVGGTLLALSACFHLFHSLYTTEEAFVAQEMAGKATNKFDFLLLTFCSLTEGDPLPWFPKWSAGTLMQTREYGQRFGPGGSNMKNAPITQNSPQCHFPAKKGIQA